MEYIYCSYCCVSNVLYDTRSNESFLVYLALNFNGEVMRHPPIHLSNSITLQCIQKEHYEEAIAIAEQVINTQQRYGTRSVFKFRMRIKSSPKFSIVLLDNDCVIGGYFFNEESNILHEFGLTEEKLFWAERNIHRIKKNKRNMVRSLIHGLKKHKGRGIEGVGLYLLPEYRNKGLGKALIQYPYEILCDQFSYIWGGQEKDLNNLFDWLKRRELIYDTGRCFYTIASLRG